MEPANSSHLWILLLSGLAVSGLGGIFLWNHGRRTGFFHAVNPAMADHTAKRLAKGLLAVGTAWLAVFTFEVIPFPHSRPFWMVTLSIILLPLATIAFAGIIALIFFRRKG